MRMSAATLALLLVIGGALMLFPIMLSARGREQELARRVDRATSVRTDAPRPPTAPEVRPLKGRLPLSEWLRQPFTFGIKRSWGMSTGTPYLILCGLLLGGAAWMFLRAVLHLPAPLCGLAAIGGFLIGPRLQLRRQQRAADAQFSEVLPDAIDMVVRMVRAGLPVAAAIRAVGAEASAPLGGVFVTVADLTEIGVTLEEALARTSETVGNAEFRFFAVAVALQQLTGGNLAETLEILSEIIRKRRAVRLKAIAATSEIRISAMVLSAIPFFVVGALLIVSPGYLQPLVADPRGNMIAGAALLSLIFGGLTMRSMIRSSLQG